MPLADWQSDVTVAVGTVIVFFAFAAFAVVGVVDFLRGLLGDPPPDVPERSESEKLRDDIAGWL